jgi:hypothetical protein
MTENFFLPEELKFHVWSTSKVLQRDSFQSIPEIHNFYEGLICATGTNQSTKNAFNYEEWVKCIFNTGNNPYSHIFLNEGHYYEVYDIDQEWYYKNFELSFSSLCENFVDSVLPEVQKTFKHLNFQEEVDQLPVIIKTRGFRLLPEKEHVKISVTEPYRRSSERLETIEDLRSEGSSTTETSKRARQIERQIPRKKQALDWRSCLTLKREEEERVNEILKRSLPYNDKYIPKGGKQSQQGEVKVVEFCDAPITLRLISSLNSEMWLNDEIMNCYFNLLQAREDRLCRNDKERGASHFFSSFFANKLMDCSEGGKDPQYNYNNVKR